MDLETLDWHEPSLELLGIPRSMLPEIQRLQRGRTARPRAPRSAARRSPASSATSRPRCSARRASSRGDAKNTYGTGSFLLVNTGEEIVRTEKLLTTVGYKLGDGNADLRARGLDRGHRRADPVAARPAEDHRLRARGARSWRKTVDDNGGVFFVPAFSGLFAPYWRDDARGVIVGLTAYANRGHIARAALEAAAWQSREVVDAANEVADVPFTELRVDGGMTANELLMQFQADVLGVPGHPPEGDRDHRARRRLRRRPGDRLLVGPGRAAGALGRGQALGAADGRGRRASSSTRAGRRPCSGRSTGSTRALRRPTMRMVAAPSRSRLASSYSGDQVPAAEPPRGHRTRGPPCVPGPSRPRRPRARLRAPHSGRRTWRSWPGRLPCSARSAPGRSHPSR